MLFIINLQDKLNIANQKITSLEGEKKTWLQKEANLTSKIADRTIQMVKNSAVIEKLPITDPAIAKEMEETGLKGGTNQLIDDLLKHNELIPFETYLTGQ